MKKLLVVLLAAMMVLSLAAVSMAAATVGGELKLIYATDDKETYANDEEKWYDVAEAKITATTKVSDSVTGFIALKGKNAGKSPAWDEYHITIAQDYGTFKFGYFAKKLTPSLDVIKAFSLNQGVATGIKEIKTNALAEGKFNVADGFTVGLDYALDGTTTATVTDVGDIKKIYDGAYVVSFGYATDLFGGEVNYFGNGDCATDEVETVTALDVWYQPIDMLKAYVAYVDAEIKDNDDDVDPSIILGVYSDLTEAVYARFEYNLEDYDAPSENYGLKLGYKFSNGITAEFKGEQKADDTFYKELSMKVAL